MSDNNTKLIPKIEPINFSYYSYLTSYLFSYDNIKPEYSYDGTEYKEYFEIEYRKLMINQLKEQLNISPSIKRFNDKFLSRKNLSYYHNIKDDIDNNYNIDIPENLNNIIHFKQIEFIYNIYETYVTNEDIVKQFTLDFPRHKVFVNNKQYILIDELFNILSKYNRKIDVTDKLNTTTFMLSLLLICQSSFYMSFIHIHNKINKMKENYILNAKLDLYDTDNIPLLNYHVTDTKKVNEIHLTIDDFRLCCTFIASYKVMNVSTEKIIYQIKAETIFDLNFDECLIVYESM